MQSAQLELPATAEPSTDLIRLLNSPNFSELRNRPRPTWGEPEGPSQQRKVVRWTQEYHLAWKVAEGYVRWVHAPTLNELPAKVASAAWE